MMSLEDILSGQITVHIFGYASLTWKPDFEYDRSFVGYVNGYERRFWQASTYHRGTVEHPGLCATLTPVDKVGRNFVRVLFKYFDRGEFFQQNYKMFFVFFFLFIYTNSILNSALLI